MKLAILRDVLDRMEVTHAGYQHDMPYIIKTTYSLLKEAQALAHSLMEMESIDKDYHLQKLHEMLAIMGVNEPSSDTDSMYRTVMACLRGLKQLQENLDKHVASKESLLHLLGMPKSYSYEPIYEWIRDRKHEKMASDAISSAKAGIVWTDEKIQAPSPTAEDFKPKLTDDKSQVVFSEWPKETWVGDAITTIKNAMKDDDLAWTWHCNIAMQIADEGNEQCRDAQVTHEFANDCASRLMMYLFNRDTTELREKMNQQKEPTDRDKFKAWIRERAYGSSEEFINDILREYYDIDDGVMKFTNEPINSQWEAWRAASTEAVKKLAQVPDPGHTIVPADANVSASQEFPVQAGCGAEWDKSVDSLISWHERTAQGDPSEPIYDGSIVGHKSCYEVRRCRVGNQPLLTYWQVSCSLHDNYFNPSGAFSTLQAAQSYCERMEVDRVKRQQKQS